MALPPIITNSPIFKVLSGTPSKPAQETPQAPQKSGGQIQDSVTLSDTALKKLEELQKSPGVSTADQARATAAETRASLESNTDVVLGLDQSREY